MPRLAAKKPTAQLPASGMPLLSDVRYDTKRSNLVGPGLATKEEAYKHTQDMART